MELDRILGRLVEFEVEFVLIGGLAAAVYGSPVLTDDIDVCLNFTRENLDRLWTAMRELHPAHRLAAQRLPFEITASNWDRFKNLYLETDWGILDCLGEVKGIGSYAEALSASQLVEFPFGPCRMLTLEALIRAKEAAGRPHDLASVAYLRALKGKTDRG